jgi:hypothetical protein
MYRDAASFVYSGSKRAGVRRYPPNAGRVWPTAADALHTIKITVRCCVAARSRCVKPAGCGLPAGLPESERQALRALILDELRRLHEGPASCVNVR